MKRMPEESRASTDDRAKHTAENDHEAPQVSRPLVDGRQRQRHANRKDRTGGAGRENTPPAECFPFTCAELPLHENADRRAAIDRETCKKKRMVIRECPCSILRNGDGDVVSHQGGNNEKECADRSEQKSLHRPHSSLCIIQSDPGRGQVSAS
jgi:hypothetical protein